MTKDIYWGGCRKPKISKRREKRAFQKLDNGGPYHGKRERQYVRWFTGSMEI